MKNLKLTHINPEETAKVCAILYVPFGGLYIIAGGFMMLSPLKAVAAEGLTIVIIGFLLPVLGWIMVWLTMLFMNWVMKNFGGITIGFEEVTKSK